MSSQLGEILDNSLLERLWDHANRPKGRLSAHQTGRDRILLSALLLAPIAVTRLLKNSLIIFLVGLLEYI